MEDVFGHGGIGAQGVFGDWGGQYQPFKGAASAEGHIYLSRGEGGSRVDDHPVECQSLAFVDGDGPGQAQGHLGECPLHLGLYRVGLFVDLVFRVLPYLWCHLYRGLAAGDTDGGAVVVGSHDMAYQAVVILAGGGVVLDEHHLGSRLDDKFFSGRVGQLGECPFDLRPVSYRVGGELAQLVLVVAVSG